MAAYLAWSLLNFDWAPATGPFWLLAGAAWVVVGETSPARGEGAEVLRGWRPAVGVAAVVAALALVVSAQAAAVGFFLGQPWREARLARLVHRPRPPQT